MLQNYICCVPKCTSAQIKGMEEGMHSMRVGGKRRIIMPQGMGYTVQGLGPYPADPRKRDVLVQVSIASRPVASRAGVRRRWGCGGVGVYI